MSGLEIEHFFTLDEDELASVRERRGPLNRLALALQIGFLKMTGRTLNSVELIPPQILDHLGRQADCVAADRLDPGILSPASPDPVRAPRHAASVAGTQ